MKKTLCIIMVLLLGLCMLAGCSGSSSAPAATGGDAETATEESSSIDYTASGVQQISAARVDTATLQATVDWFYDWQFVQGKQASDLKYEDFVKQIGSEPNEYEWYENEKVGVYTWYASDDDGVKITPSFVDGYKNCKACGMQGIKPAYLEELMD